MSELDAILGIAFIILSAGLLSVFFHWGLFTVPKRLLKELDDEYIPEALRPFIKPSEEDEEEIDDKEGAQ